MRKMLVCAFLASAMVMGSQAHALTYANVPCAASDIGVDVTPDFACGGFYTGNLASAATSGDIHNALLGLGLDMANPYANAVEKLNFTGSTVAFDTELYGITFIGIHWGNIPNPAGGKPLANNITSFYKFDAGTDGITNLSLAFGSGSNFTIYQTGTAPAVPEPATWAMMIGGLGLVGATMRRRAAKVQFA